MTLPNITPTEAGRVLGSMRTEKKARAVRETRMQRLGKLGGRPLKPLLSVRCTCGAGERLENHPSSCPRGYLIWRRRRDGLPLT